MTSLLDVVGVSKRFSTGGLMGRRIVHAVDDASFSLSADRPEIFTVIGESGSGKTTLARMILGLEDPTEGEIRVRGERVSRRDGRRKRLEYMSIVQPVFQNPFEAFNPLKRVDRYLESTARRFLKTKDPAVIAEACDTALQKVGLSLAEIGGRFPHEMSGGQLQRTAIARALIPNPRLLIADEPVSMVDASLRMSIVNLLRDLRDAHGVSVIYITHDLATAYYISDRLMIMQRGLIVEMGPARAVLDAPRHAYSRLLKDSVLSTDAAGDGRLDSDQAAIRDVTALAGRPSRLVEQPDGRLLRVCDGP